MFKPAVNLTKQFVEGVGHINLSDGMVRKMFKEEGNMHFLGAILAQQFSLKADLKKFYKKGKQSVMS